MVDIVFKKVPSKDAGVPTDKAPPPDSKTRSKYLDNTDRILDSDWVTSAFMVSNNKLPEGSTYRLNKFYSTASRKFTDTTFGGNIGINSRPQICRFADIRDPGRYQGRTRVTKTSTGNHGMGRWYSEVIDDNSQTIYLRFGMAEFSGMGRYLSTALDFSSATLARTGRAPSILYTAALTISTIAAVITFPIVAALVFLGKLVKTVFGAHSHKFYYMKPTMHLYWNMVQSIVTPMCVNLGLIHPAGDSVNDGAPRIGAPLSVDTVIQKELARLLPDVYDIDGHIDVYAIANRASRLSMRQWKIEYAAWTEDSDTDFTGYVSRHDKKVNRVSSKHSLLNYMTDLITSNSYYKVVTDAVTGKQVREDIKGGPTSSANSSEMEIDSRYEESSPDPTTGEITHTIKESWLTEAKKSYDAEISDGSQFAIFKVNATGSTSTTISNQTATNPTKSLINSQVKTSRNFLFSTAGGKTGVGAIDGVVGTISDGVRDVVMGTLDGYTFGLSNVLSMLGGGGYMDVPDQWDDSSVDFPTIAYTIDLIAPYRHPVSMLQNVYVPLAMLMAGAVPIATGKASYTSPLLVQIFDRGRQHIQTGIFKSITIEAGTSNLSFSNTGLPMGFKVSFTIIDLSKVMYMPVGSGFLSGAASVLDEDTSMFTYINSITGLDLIAQVYVVPRLKRKTAQAMASAKTLKSPYYWSQIAGESWVGTAMSFLVPLPPHLVEAQKVN